MLRLDDLACGYGAVRAVSGLSFEIAEGEIFALLGPNGAGKTSTIMAIMGHVQVQQGSIRFAGEDITRARAIDRAAMGIALMPEGRRLFSDMNVTENLAIGGYSRPRRRAAGNMDRVFGLFPRLAERRDQIAGSLSGGEQQMLAMGRALMAEPKLLLVDELSLGLMPKMIDIFIDVLRRLRDEALAVLLVEQNTARALAVADRVCVLASGSPVHIGSPAEIDERSDLFESFLGLPERPTSI